MTGALRARRMIAPLLMASALAGCGPPPPEAPLRDAMKLDSATSGISTACGLTYQVTAFPGEHKMDLETLEATASSSAIKLAGVYRRNPAWIYQGETISEIVSDSVTMLRACGLNEAANTLVHATAG